MFTRRDDFGSQLPNVIIGNPIGTGKASKDYEAAKSGDVVAAVRLTKQLVTPELLRKVAAALCGRKPIVAGVASIEFTGINQLPTVAATAIGLHLSLEVETEIVQASSPMRTAMSGLDRIFAAPVFDGEVQPGRGYLLLDDTVTQGATFAALASHIKAGGGHVVSVVALTGKDYSRTIKPSPETLAKLREHYADLESTFKAATGYGFDGLTQSEARYLANYKPSGEVRNRIIEAGKKAGGEVG